MKRNLVKKILFQLLTIFQYGLFKTAIFFLENIFVLSFCSAASGAGAGTEAFTYFLKFCK